MHDPLRAADVPVLGAAVSVKHQLQVTWQDSRHCRSGFRQSSPDAFPVQSHLQRLVATSAALQCFVPSPAKLEVSLAGPGLKCLGMSAVRSPQHGALRYGLTQVSSDILQRPGAGAPAPGSDRETRSAVDSVLMSAHEGPRALDSAQKSAPWPEPGLRRLWPAPSAHFEAPQQLPCICFGNICTNLPRSPSAPANLVFQAQQSSALVPSSGDLAEARGSGAAKISSLHPEHLQRLSCAQLPKTSLDCVALPCCTRAPGIQPLLSISVALPRVRGHP
mmetsp:Transcript_7891/g.14000  ORF Transcript_7891/g.14000 Transcript_7891/m.14000 type:complete len:276 (-) Transcript_7891:268-1095(-)